MYNEVVSKKIIFLLLIGAAVGIMLFASIYGFFDIHDTKPFPIDPESAVVVASAMLVLSFRALLITVPLFGLLLPLQAWLAPLVAEKAQPRIEAADPAPCASPPFSAISLRI